MCFCPAIFAQSEIQQMCANYRFQVATWFNTFGEIGVNVKFTHPNSRINSRIFAPLVFGAVWAWWMLLGRDSHWMMRNEAGERILSPQIPQKDPIILRFPPKTSKFG